MLLFEKSFQRKTKEDYTNSEKVSALYIKPVIRSVNLRISNSLKRAS